MKIFNILTSLGKEKEIDLETAIKNYVEYSNVTKKAVDENGKEIPPEEKRHYRKCFEEAQNALKQICKMLENENAESVAEYINTFTKLYEENKDDRRFIKKALLEKFSVNLVKKWRIEASAELYDSISKMERVLPLGDSGYFTYDANAAIYGWSKGNEKDKSFYPPLPNESITSTLKQFIEHEDKEHLIQWIKALLSYDKKNFAMSDYGNDYNPERIVLQKNLSNMMKEDEKLRAILVKELLEGSLLFDLVNQSKEAERVSELETQLQKQVEDFELEKEEREQSYQERAARQKELIDQLDARITQLVNAQKQQERLEDLYERAGIELTKAKEDLFVQRQINEDIKKSDMEQLARKNEEIEALNHELLLTKAELVDIRENLEAINVDITLKNNEIARLKESVGSKDSDATDNLLKGLVSSLNNQIFYLSMFYQILSEDNGVLDEMNLEMFKEVLVQVDSALAEIGLKKLGSLDEIVEYNSALHNPVSESISNGEKVKVTGFGWEINGEVFIKVPVEREVE